ncbi:MAG: hypothetical protein IKH08_01270 [Prevotella sp.]|nr:hypothetical protein [Prevotella sp.]MBR4601491.1 hypothetical protein [Prevotella sp.]
MAEKEQVPLCSPGLTKTFNIPYLIGRTRRYAPTTPNFSLDPERGAFIAKRRKNS